MLYYLLGLLLEAFASLFPLFNLAPCALSGLNPMGFKEAVSSTDFSAFACLSFSNLAFYL
tara:strand:+ start:336 stop:515 length:180 start_codon:yes stop_codon:yes gene_type:complete